MIVKTTCCVYIYRFIALPIGRHFNLRETVSKPVPKNDTLEKLFKQHRKIYPSDNVILVMILSLRRDMYMTFIFS